MLQARLEIMSSDSNSAFLARPREAGLVTDDPEAHSYQLLYRDAREFASGHGVSADWELDDDRGRARRIWSEFIPTRELPSLTAASDIAGSSLLDMKLLSECATGVQVLTALSPLVDGYDQWVTQQFALLDRPPFDTDSSLKKIGEEHLRRCESSAKRMRTGLQVLAADLDVFEIHDAQTNRGCRRVLRLPSRSKRVLVFH
jgi:hypothetical protein